MEMESHNKYIQGAHGPLLGDTEDTEAKLPSVASVGVRKEGEALEKGSSRENDSKVSGKVDQRTCLRVGETCHRNSDK